VFETINLNRRIGTSACNVYILFPYPGTPIQIEHKIPIRGENGKMLPVAQAKHLGLSKMSPDELEGLQHTFNLYLHMPKELWPLVRLAEASDERGLTIRELVRRFTVSALSSDAADFVALETALPQGKTINGVAQDLQIPKALAAIYRFELTDDELRDVTAAFVKFEASRAAPAPVRQAS
jgi:hypothetical protein